jgi:hypothetical protein
LTSAAGEPFRLGGHERHVFHSLAGKETIMKHGPQEHLWMLALAGASLAGAVAACGGGSSGDGAMLAKQRSMATQAPATAAQAMPAMDPDAATLMQMGGAP